MKVLGISAFYHDSAAALISDGEIIAAVQEERFTRIKHDASFPVNAIEFCLNESRFALSDIDLIVFYEKPLLKFKRLLSTYVRYAPKGFGSFRKALPIWLGTKLFQKRHILNYFSKKCASVNWKDRLLFSEHHLSHAASAFFPSPFEKAVVLCLDGVGEWCTTTVYLGDGNSIRPLREITFPHSLGLLYSAFTYYTGFKVNSGEYKLMGLAPYGKPRYTDIIKDNLIDIKEDGSYRLNLKYFNYCTGLTMTNDSFDDLFDQPRRLSESPITQFHMDIAASIQEVTEEIVIKIASYAKKISGVDYLCLAGGVALNCVANGKLERQKIFKNIWIQPASGDAGGALGAAYAGLYLYADKRRAVMPSDAMKGGYLGPSFTDGEVKRALDLSGARYEYLNDEELNTAVVALMKSGGCLGWFQGRMEYGPRALGARSIIADPRSQDMQTTLNLKIKFRESFRPFAPAVLSDYAKDWFDLDSTSPYMLKVADVNKQHQIAPDPNYENAFGLEKLKLPRSTIPAITHVNYSARIQTVHKETNKKFYDLLTEFYNQTGCPIVINTSFNIRGEPIVCTPKDAFNCFMGTELDALVINNFIMYKDSQDDSLRIDYRNRFRLD